MTEFLKRHVISLLLAVGFVVLGVFVVQRTLEVTAAETGGRGGGATPVVVADVVRAPFIDTLQAVGSAIARESVEISANASDRVTALTFREGEYVEAGEVLVQLDTTQEEAELAEARANLADQRRQFERFDSLVETNSAARSQRDEALARMQAAEARMDVIRARIEDRTVRAPFSGVLGLREVSTGALVTPGTRITTLDAVQPIELEFSIPEQYLSVLARGATIRARTPAWPEDDFRGVVAHISPRVDPVTRAVTIRAELPNEDLHLRPGMLLTVDLVRDRREGLMVPESALIPSGDRQYLYRLADDSAERIEVAIGSRRPGVVEITGGLEAGDTVVVEGAVRLRPGQPVRVQREIDALALISEDDLDERPPEGSAVMPASSAIGDGGAAEVGG